VPVKTVAQQVLSSLHRLRAGWMAHAAHPRRSLSGLARSQTPAGPPARVGTQTRTNSRPQHQSSRRGTPLGLRPSRGASPSHRSTSRPSRQQCWRAQSPKNHCAPAYPRLVRPRPGTSCERPIRSTLVSFIPLLCGIVF
jgi:hypothetical protein